MAADHSKWDRTSSYWLRCENALLVTG